MSADGAASNVGVVISESSGADATVAVDAAVAVVEAVASGEEVDVVDAGAAPG
jgi:hypothetical protein